MQKDIVKEPKVPEVKDIEESVSITKQELDNVNARLSNIRTLDNSLVFARESFTFFLDTLKKKYGKLSYDFKDGDFENGVLIFTKKGDKDEGNA